MAVGQCCGQWTLLAGCMKLIPWCVFTIRLSDWRTAACLTRMQQAGNRAY